jgi:hypothetical protein
VRSLQSIGAKDMSENLTTNLSAELRNPAYNDESDGHVRLRAADEIDRLTERLAGAYASVNLLTEMLEAKAPQEATGLQDKIARAYGYLWHVNNSGVGFQFSPEKAAHMARRVLRDTLTHEQRGNAINMAATELFEILRNEGNE